MCYCQHWFQKRLSSFRLPSRFLFTYHLPCFLGAEPGKKIEENPIHNFFLIQEQKAICRICNTILAYKTSAYATGLVKHLKNVVGHEESYALYAKLKSELAKKREHLMFRQLSSLFKGPQLPFIK